MKPFLSGRPNSTVPPLQPLTPPVLKEAASPRVASHSHGGRKVVDSESAPTVECVKQGDKVVRLIVTCSCGERIEIDCLYPGMG